MKKFILTFSKQFEVEVDCDDAAAAHSFATQFISKFQEGEVTLLSIAPPPGKGLSFPEGA